MPSAPRVRKEILAALQQDIIPPLRNEEVALGEVAPPFRFTSRIEAQLIDKKVPRPSTTSPAYPIQAKWPKIHLLSSFHSYFGFLYAGDAEERTIVDRASATKHKTAKGLYSIHWQAPGVLMFPPGAPRRNGREPSASDDNASSIGIKVLWVDILQTDILLHTHIERNGQIEVSSSLQVTDGLLTDLSHVFIRGLHDTPKNQGVSQAILLAFMLRLRQIIQTTIPKFCNTARPPTPTFRIDPSLESPHDVWQNTVIFIQTHLHENLSLPLIAKQSGFSPAHLSRLCNQFTGMPVMKYVRLQRIAAAKMMLSSQPENITEIAQMTGFSSATAFCGIFRRETGLTPGQFRQKCKASLFNNEHSGTL